MIRLGSAKAFSRFRIRPVPFSEKESDFDLNSAAFCTFPDSQPRTRGRSNAIRSRRTSGTFADNRGIGEFVGSRPSATGLTRPLSNEIKPTLRTWQGPPPPPVLSPAREGAPHTSNGIQEKFLLFGFFLFLNRSQSRHSETRSIL